MVEKKKKKHQAKATSKPDRSLNPVKNLTREERVKRVYKALLNDFKIPKRFEGKNFDNYQPSEKNKKGFARVKKYAENFEERFQNGDWLLMTGGYGLGKTHLALAAAKEILKYFAVKHIDRNPNQIYYAGATEKIIFTTSSELIQDIRDSYDSDNVNEQEVMNRFKTTPLLIIDDLGTEKASEWQQEKMYIILDYRYRELLPTIITTNLEWEELENHISLRVIERMIEAAGHGKYLRKFQGKSYRRSQND